MSQTNLPRCPSPLGQRRSSGPSLKEFPKYREEPKSVLKNLVMTGAYDPGCQILIRLDIHRLDLLKPQNESKKQDAKTLRMVFELLRFQHLRDQKKKACKIAAS